MNQFSASLHTAAIWAQAQLKTLAANLADVASNHPEPAMQALICSAVTVALGWAALKLVKKVSR